MNNRHNIYNVTSGNTEKVKNILNYLIDMINTLNKKQVKLILSNNQKTYPKYQIHGASESSNISKNTSAIISVIKKHLSGERKMLRLALANCWKNTGKQYYLNCSNYRSCKAYLKSIKYNYINIEIYLLVLTTIIPAEIYKYLTYKKNK